MLNSSQTYTATFTTVLVGSHCYPQLPAQYLSWFQSFLHQGDPASWDDKFSLLCSYQTDQNIRFAWHFLDLFTLDKRNINYTDLKKKVGNNKLQVATYVSQTIINYMKQCKLFLSYDFTSIKFWSNCHRILAYTIISISYILRTTRYQPLATLL